MQKFCSEIQTSYMSLSMSITYLLLFFLCISLHACNARHLNTLEKKPHLSIKGDEKNGFDSFPKGKRMKTWLVDDIIDHEKPKDQRSSNRRVLKVKAMGKASSGALQRSSESLVSVSWRVPHKEHNEKNPGFNLDYSPPKTHPPSHN